MPGLIDFTNPMVDAAHARYTQLKQSGMPDEQIFQVMDQEKTLVPLGQLAAKVMALKNAAQQTPMPPQNTINEQVDQQIQQMQNPQQQGIGALPQNAVTPPQGQMPQGAPAPQQMPQGMPQQAPAPQQMPQGMPQQAQAPAPQQSAPQQMPQGMAEGGLATLPVDNVGDEKAYAAGGIVAFANRGLVEDDSNDDDYSGFTFSTGPDTTAPASQFILGNQPLGVSPAPTQRKQTNQTDKVVSPPALDKSITTSTEKDSAKSYFDAFQAHIDEEQKKLDAVKPQSVDDIMKEYAAYKKAYGTGAATTLLNQRVDEMENDIKTKSDYYEKLANKKKWAAVGEQASKTGQGGNDLNKLLTALIAGDKAYTEATEVGDKALEAQKDKIFENRLAINKLAQEESTADLRNAISEHKNQITQQTADKKSLVSERLTLLKEQAAEEQRLIGNRTAQAQIAAYSDPYKEVERRYIAAKQAGNTKLADQLYDTMQKLKAAGSGAALSKTTITAIQNQINSLVKEATALQYTDPVTAKQKSDEAQELRRQLQGVIGSVDPTGLTANTPGLSNTSVDTTGWGNLQVR